MAKSIIDEILDLVDEDDKIIGTMPRSEIYAKDLTNHRVVNLFITNSKSEIWIPRRGPQKRIFPLCLDMSMGGHVETGESYEEAFRRELKEELNLNPDKISYKLLGHLTPHQHNLSAFMNVYEIRSDDAPDYNKNDFIEYYWLTPEEFFKRLEKGEKTKEDLPKLVRFFYQSQP